MLCNNKSKSNAKRPLWPVCVVSEINVICTHLHTDTFQAFSSTCLLFYYRYTRDAQIMVEINGVSQKALFSFEAFRLVDNEYETVSTFYLLCVTRLCEVSKRRSLLSVSSLHRLWSLKYYVFNFCSVLWTFPLPVWRWFCSFSCFWHKFGSSERLCKKKVNKYVSESTIVTSPAIHVRSQRRKAVTLVLSSIGMLSYLAVNNSTNIKGNKVEDRQYYIFLLVWYLYMHLQYFGGKLTLWRLSGEHFSCIIL